MDLVPSLATDFCFLLLTCTGRCMDPSTTLSFAAIRGASHETLFFQPCRWPSSDRSHEPDQRLSFQCACASNCIRALPFISSNVLAMSCEFLIVMKNGDIFTMIWSQWIKCTWSFTIDIQCREERLLCLSLLSYPLKIFYLAKEFFLLSHYQK